VTEDTEIGWPLADENGPSYTMTAYDPIAIAAACTETIWCTIGPDVSLFNGPTGKYALYEPGGPASFAEAFDTPEEAAEYAAENGYVLIDPDSAPLPQTPG
jgi:hypothetical protein